MRLLYTLLGSCTIAASVVAVDFSNLPNCVNDIKQNIALPSDQRPFFTTDYQSLMMSLNAGTVRSTFPEVYQRGMLNPFISWLTALGQAHFQVIFGSMQPNPTDGFYKDIIPDVTEAILQNGLGFATKATNAFQEMVSDLYDGFLSDESRVSKETGRPIKPPDRGILPPLVKWGNPGAGPYTWPADATAELRLGAGIVSLPPSHLKGGLLAWSTLPHETAGHDILHADNGLLQELGNAVYNAVLFNIPNGAFLANYWRGCIDETASDVLGLMNAGPTAGVGLVGYFRGLFNGKLRNVGYLPPADGHPIDLLRGIIAAAVVGQMPFASAFDWSAAITSEVYKDLQPMFLIDPQTRQNIPLNQDDAIRSAQIVAFTIMKTKLMALEGHSLDEIQNWNEQDQKIAEELAVQLQKGVSLPQDYRNSGYLAAHVVAGATIAALQTGADIQTLFGRMIDYLDLMHQYNSTWSSTIPDMPTPPNPTNPQPDCVACLCECFQKCINKPKPAVRARNPRSGTNASEALALIDQE